jgi:hypothetical protein
MKTKKTLTLKTSAKTLQVSKKTLITLGTREHIVIGLLELCALEA